MTAASLRVAFGDRADAVLRFSFDGESNGVAVHCPRLAGPTAPEVWCGDASACSVITVTVPESGDDLETAANEGYRQLLTQLRDSQHPHLVRIWNYMDAINEGEGDAERYRRFCVGRAAAIDAAALSGPPPAATAIGHPHRSGHLHLVALCGTEPPIALENPRQMPAWTYPRVYGPVSPGFSRGALTGEGGDMRLLASGTASIVGHRSLHAEDAAAQMREALDNLAALMQQAHRVSGRSFQPEHCEALRVYLRSPADLPAVAAVLAASAIPQAATVLLHGDICRRELLVELEGVFAAV